MIRVSPEYRVYLEREQVGRTLALSVLSALLAGKSGPAVAEALDRGGVGACLLQELVDTAHHSLLQVRSLLVA